MESTIPQKLEALVKIQTVDSKIDSISKVRGALPDEVRDLEDELAGYETRIEKYNEDLKDLENEISDKKNAIKESKKMIEKYESQQMNVRNNREYDALSKEIELQTLEIQISEKRIKEAEEKIEAKKEEIESTNELSGERNLPNDHPRLVQWSCMVQKGKYQDLLELLHKSRCYLFPETSKNRKILQSTYQFFSSSRVLESQFY